MAEALGLAEGLADGETLAERDPDTDGEAEGLALSEGEGDAEGL